MTSLPFAARRDRLRSLLDEKELHAGLITNLTNIRYLTGFTGSNAALLVLVDRSDDIFCTDSRYELQAATEVPNLEHVVERDCAITLIRRAGHENLRRIGFEAHDVTVELYNVLNGQSSELQLASLDRSVEKLRLVKDEDEIALLRHACLIADKALAQLLDSDRIRPERTESEVARELDNLMLAGGADAVSFETIVATGVNSAIPHHRPADHRIKNGDFVKVDFGATYRGYHSDMTRVFVISQVADWQRDIYELVRNAQEVGISALRAGANTDEIDLMVKKVVTDRGYEPYQHGLGHGVGLEVHEAPAIRKTVTGKLANSMTVAVEPGIYLPGRGGVRIEDTLVVRKNGPELLTTTPKDLLVL